MQTAPSNYNSIYEEGNYETQYKVNIDGVDYDQSYIWSMKTSRKLFADNKPTIGGAMDGQIDLTIMNPGVTFSRMARIRPYIRLYSKTRRIYSGWLQKGEFFIDTRESDDADDIKTITIQGFDAMRKANQVYPSSTLTWNASGPTAYNVVREIAGFMFNTTYYGGSSYIEQETITKLNATPYVIGFPAQYTMAEVLGSIAAMYGGNFCISSTGKLMLVSLTDLPEETYLLMNEKGNYITFGGVRIKLRA